MARPSPFPGMDPWLQAFWGNVHTKVCANVTDAINDQLGPGLVAVTNQRVLVEGGVGSDRGVYPDVYLVRHPQPYGGGAAVAEPDTSDEPIVAELAAAAFEQPYIEIVDATSGRAVVTVVEIVSPSNRRAGEGRDLYRQKQSEVVASSASLVEIDLTRGHRGVTLAWRHSIAAALETTYHACVLRATRRTALEVYPIGLRRRLPSIRIPLRAGEPDARVDLQHVFDDTYRRGRMAELIDYARPPEPPLDEADLPWVMGRVAAWRAGATVG